MFDKIGFLAQCRRNNFFPDRILWTDEATFTPNGVFNSRNHLFWAEENPHAVRVCRFQYRWAINVWAGVIGNQIVSNKFLFSKKLKKFFLRNFNRFFIFGIFQIGPYFLPPRLNGETYHHFLQNELPALLEDVPLHVRAEIIFQHDGAPAHFSRQVRDFLDAHYPERWMGRGGPIIWPARSPDLNVLDFFMGPHKKSSRS